MNKLYYLENFGKDLKIFFEVDGFLRVNPQDIIDKLEKELESYKNQYNSLQQLLIKTAKFHNVELKENMSMPKKEFIEDSKVFMESMTLLEKYISITETKLFLISCKTNKEICKNYETLKLLRTLQE